MDTHDVPGKELVIGSSETAALMVLAKVGWEVGKGRGGGGGRRREPRSSRPAWGQFR